MLRPTETAHQKLSRMLNMGKFGEELAQEILDQYMREVRLREVLFPMRDDD